MHYVSTRGQSPAVDFEQAMMTGLAPDGGLYVPRDWPRWDAAQWASLRGLPYAEVALAVMTPFVGDAVKPDELRTIVRQACEAFRHPCVAPLVKLDDDRWCLELFHGPTLAFKDVAMQVLGRLYDHVLTRRNDRLTLVGATSGDTGSAAIEAVRGRERAAIVIMHPHQRTSEVQRRQMTTVDAANVHNLAVRGTFDDCQAMLKAMFADVDFRESIRLSGVNSINWARVLPQVVYYVTAALELGAPEREVDFSVPTGNFGDIFAGYVALRMGLPIGRLVIASNSNDILPRVLATGEHTLGSVEPTISPSMDIQVSSNFERLLFEAYERDAAAVRGLMQQLKLTRSFTLRPDVLARLRTTFAAMKVDEATTLATIRLVFERCGGYLVDPHTAVGIAAGEAHQRPGVPMVCLATAHPAKFPDAVQRATGVRPPLPPHLAHLFDLPERYTVIDHDYAAVTAAIRRFSGGFTTV